MKKILLSIVMLFASLHLANAQALLRQYIPGDRLINGSQLNRMVDEVNGLTGNGTAGTVKGTAITATTSVTSPLVSATTSLTTPKIITNSAVPILSSCGGSPSVVGSNTAGRLVTGSAATTCTITFATAYTAAPFCVVSAEVATQPTFTVSNTAITFATSIASTAYSYICIAASGG